MILPSFAIRPNSIQRAGYPTGRSLSTGLKAFTRLEEASACALVGSESYLKSLWVTANGCACPV